MFSKLLLMDFQALLLMVLVSVPPMLMYLIMSSAELREEIQTAIPSIVKCLKDLQWNVQWAALNGLLYLATHGMCLCSSNADVPDHVFS